MSLRTPPIPLADGVGTVSYTHLSEDGSLFGKSMIFVAMAEGIALYGLIISFMILGKDVYKRQAKTVTDTEDSTTHIPIIDNIFFNFIFILIAQRH